MKESSGGKKVGIAALLTLSGSILKLLKDLREESGHVDLYTYGGFALFVIILLFDWIRRRWFAPPPSFLRPTELDIGRKHFVGRDVDLEHLLKRIKNYRLVWLFGDSGVGKSSLLKFGLVPRLLRDKSFIPFYIEDWGSTWDNGPREALCRSIIDTLGEAMPEELELSKPITVEHAISVLREIHTTLNRTPVLIFDQFEDYQTRHKDQFFDGAENKLIEVHHLKEKNAFWSEIIEIFDEHIIKCVFAFREDRYWLLECVRFSRPEFFPLGRLQRTYATELLDEITKGDVVANPNPDWELLKRRVLDDLEENGSVLPIQMKFAFRGLGQLRALSVGHYEREGGSSGLEALDLKWHLADAADVSSLTENNIRKLLSALVGQRRTVPRTTTELLNVLPEESRNEDQVHRALERLQDADILRESIDVGQDKKSVKRVWLLYHDYLCRASDELNRRERRLQAILDNSAATFYKASRFIDGWRALLSPMLQAKLAIAWLKGRLRYGASRRYAILSAARLFFIIGLFVAMLGVVGWGYIHMTIKQDARSLFSAFTLAEDTSGYEVDALWRLARERESARRAFYEIVFSERRNAERFLVKSDHIIQATFGLSEKRRQHLLLDVLRNYCYQDSVPEYSDVCLELLDTAPPSMATSDVAKTLWGRILKLISQTKEYSQLSEFSHSFEMLAHKLAPEAAYYAFDRTVTTVPKLEDPSRLAALASGLDSLGGKLHPQASKDAADRIHDMVAQGQNSLQLVALARALRALGGDRLSPDTARYVGSYAVETISLAEDPEVLLPLACGLGAFADKMPSELARSAFHRVLVVMSRTKDSSSFAKLAGGLGCLSSARIPVGELDLAADQIITFITLNQEATPPPALVNSLESLSAYLEAKSVGNLYNQIVEAITRTQIFWRLSTLEGSMQSLGDRLVSEAAEDAAGRIVGIMNNTQDSGQLYTLASGLEALGQNLPAVAADRAGMRIVEIMEDNEDRWQLSRLVDALYVLAGRLSPETSDSAAERIYQMMTKRQDSWRLIDLARGIGSLEQKSSQGAARSAARRIIEEMIRVRGFRDIARLAKALRFLGGDMPPELVVRATDRIAEAVAQDDSWQLAVLDSKDLGFLYKKISLETMRHDAERIADAMTRARDGWQLSVQTRVLISHGDGVASETYGKVFSALLRAMARTKGEGDELYSLAGGVAALGEVLEGEEVDDSLRVLIGYLGSRKDPECAWVAPFIRDRRESLQQIVEFLKWPVCSAEDRVVLISKVSSVTGSSFENEWSFIRWAEDSGYDPGRPPEDPKPLRSILDDLKGRYASPYKVAKHFLPTP